MDDHDDGVHWDYSKNSNNMFAGGSMLVSSKVGLAVGIIITMVVAIVCGWWWHYVLSKESKARTSSNKKAPLPPGSLGLPLLGETLEFLRLTQANRSAEFLNRRVAKYGQVFKTHLLFSPAVSVGAPDGNKFLFANENKLVQNSWPSPVKKLFGPNSLMNKTGEQHKHARRIFTSFFGPDGLQRFVPRMDKMVRAHFVQFWEGKDEIMAFAVIKQFAFALAADLFFSITEGPQFWSLERDLFTLSQGIAQPPLDFPGTAYHNAKLSRNRILCTLDTIICQRRKDMEEGKISSQHDLLSVMISTRDQDQDQLATNEDIKDNILMFLYAGHDTSVSTLAGALKYLFLNPQCLQQVIKEQKEIAIEKAGSPLNWDDTRKMKYTWQVMQECLRVQPALELFWHLGRSHMSPQFFPNPERFDPDRFEGLGPPPFIYMPFGGGPRICLGAEFARTEMVVFLHYLVLNYEWNMVDPNEGVVRNPLPVFQKGLPLKIRMKQPLEFH
ncbi:hypothetical protein CY35_11G074800 [Sphagnum magellanicum]|nr:hypothetical protein CY35_11G074800 [Sphagnum magellanicum]